MPPKELRRIICEVTYDRPDPGNWSDDPNVWEEVQYLIHNRHWPKVYDIAEAFFANLRGSDKRDFPDELNEVFRSEGIGWKISGGRIETRGEKGYEQATSEAKTKLAETGRGTAASELALARGALSARPHPDNTGAIQHAIASIECLARDLTEDKLTLGATIKKYREKLGIPKPLDEALLKLWGYSSETGRHLVEGGEPSRCEAELVVFLSAALINYLLAKKE